MVRNILIHLLTAIALTGGSLHAQQDTAVVTLSPLVGPTISRLERTNYRIMAQEGYPDADSIRVLQAADGNLFLRIYVHRTFRSAAKVITLPMTQQRFLAVKASIESASSVMTVLNRALREGAPKVRIRTWDNQVFVGKPLELNGQKVIILTQYGVVDIPFERIQLATSYQSI
jgi:hypothetical protein